LGLSGGEGKSWKNRSNGKEVPQLSGGGGGTTAGEDFRRERTSLDEMCANKEKALKGVHDGKRSRSALSGKCGGHEHKKDETQRRLKILSHGQYKSSFAKETSRLLAGRGPEAIKQFRRQWDENLEY